MASAAVRPLTDELYDAAMAANDNGCLTVWRTSGGPERANQYYRARYYDPKLGRFLTEDPIGFSGGNNFYAYVGNAPTINVDPLGLGPWRPPTELRGCFTQEQRAYCDEYCKDKGGVKTCNVLISTKLKWVNQTDDVQTRIRVEEVIWPPQCTCNKNEDDGGGFCGKMPATCALVAVTVGVLVWMCTKGGGTVMTPAPQPGGVMTPATGSNGGA